jgi:hypothetical protein
VLGAGERLFGETSEQRPMRLVEARTVDDLAYLSYRKPSRGITAREVRENRSHVGAVGKVRASPSEGSAKAP